MKLQIVEMSVAGYPKRTKQNIMESDITFIISQTESLGERLTRNICRTLRKPYIDITFGDKYPDKHEISRIVGAMNSLDIMFIRLNIAGNGIYNLNMSQKNLNGWLYCLLEDIEDSKEKRFEIELVLSGGQTGIDEAAIIAAIDRKIPAKINAPKGFVFRDKDRNDIPNQEEFIKRFLNQEI